MPHVSEAIYLDTRWAFYAWNLLIMKIYLFTKFYKLC